MENWIIYSAVMFFGSIIYYLIVKKVQQLGADKHTYMAVNSIVPTILFLLLALTTSDTLMLSLKGFVLAFLGATVLNYFGSYFGYLGIEKAPNAGYAVIIQKSYALYTSILSVVLFNSELPFSKVLAILLIIVAAGFVIVDKKDGKFKFGSWVWYSIATFFLFGMTTVFAKYISLWGDSTMAYLFWLLLGTTVMSWIRYYFNRKRVSTKLDKKMILWLIAMSTMVSVFYWGKIQTTVTAPNIGYSGAVNASSNAVLVVVSAWLYKQELTLRKLLGALGVIAGLVVLIW